MNVKGIIKSAITELNRGLDNFLWSYQEYELPQSNGNVVFRIEIIKGTAPQITTQQEFATTPSDGEKYDVRIDLLVELIKMGILKTI